MGLTMPMSIRLCLLAAGVFLFVGLITGVMKYLAMMANEQHRAPMYIDVAHRASLMYSFAALVMAKLLQYSPYDFIWQTIFASVPLVFFAISIATYIKLGIAGQKTTQFAQRNFTTTWAMWALIVGEIGGVGMIVLGFIQTQFI